MEREEKRMNQIYNQPVSNGNDIQLVGQNFTGILFWSITVVSWNTEELLQLGLLLKCNGKFEDESDQLSTRERSERCEFVVKQCTGMQSLLSSHRVIQRKTYSWNKNGQSRFDESHIFLLVKIHVQLHSTQFFSSHYYRLLQGWDGTSCGDMVTL
jgi:hypothetical protein